MNYFVSKDDLDRAMDEERERLFTVIGKALYELEHRMSLLVNIGMRYPTKTKHKGERKMGKIKELIGKLWIIADSSDNEELVAITKGLDEYVRKTESFKEELEALTKEIKGLRERVEKREEETKKIEEKEEKKE